HIWRRKSLFTAIEKVCHPSNKIGRQTLAGAVPGVLLKSKSTFYLHPEQKHTSALSGVGAMVYLIIADRSANIGLQLLDIRGAVSLSRVEKKRYIVQSSSNPVGRKSDASIEKQLPLR